MMYQFARWFFGLFGLVPAAEVAMYAEYDALFSALGIKPDDREAAFAIVGHLTKAGVPLRDAEEVVELGARFYAHGLTGREVDQMILNHYREAAKR